MTEHRKPRPVVATGAGPSNSVITGQVDEAHNRDTEAKRQVLLRRIARRCRISLPHAATVAQLAGFGGAAW